MVFKLTKSQMLAPYRSDPKKMVAAIIRWWVDNDPDALLHFSMPQLQIMAEAALIQANRFGIVNQPEVCAFANLMWLYGPSFDSVEGIRAVLETEMDEEDKIEALYTQVPDRLWEEADRTRDESRWIGIYEDQAET